MGYLRSGYSRRCELLDPDTWLAEATSFAIFRGFFRRAEINVSTPSGRFMVSNAIRVTWTFDNWA